MNNILPHNFAANRNFDKVNPSKTFKSNLDLNVSDRYNTCICRLSTNEHKQRINEHK